MLQNIMTSKSYIKEYYTTIYGTIISQDNHLFLKLSIIRAYKALVYTRITKNVKYLYECR